jgi:hypothetical protein
MCNCYIVPLKWRFAIGYLPAFAWWLPESCRLKEAPAGPMIDRSRV